MHLFLDPRMDQRFRAAPVGAWQALSGSEQTADQRSLFVDSASVGPQVNAVQRLKRGILLGRCLTWQSGHFFGRRGHRTTAIVAAWHAFERWNLSPQIVDFLAVAAHCVIFPVLEPPLCPTVAQLDSRRRSLPLQRSTATLRKIFQTVLSGYPT